MDWLVEELRSCEVRDVESVGEQVGPKSYRVRFGGRDHLVKVLTADDQRQLTALRLALETQQSGSSLIQRVEKISERESGWIVVLQWVDGETFKDSNRDALPKFFQCLGAWHMKNRTERPIQSKYTLRGHATATEFLSNEAGYHLERLGWSSRHTLCMQVLGPLEHSLRTVTHGDVHPGNIVRTEDGFRLLDPEYMKIGLGLCDLDYLSINSLDDFPDEWWWITDQSEDCVRQYLRAVDMSADRVESAMRGLRLLTLLESHSNGMVSGSGDLPALRRAIDALLS